MTCPACGHDVTTTGTCPACGSPFPAPPADAAAGAARPDVSPWAPPGYSLAAPAPVSGAGRPGWTPPVGGGFGSPQEYAPAMPGPTVLPASPQVEVTARPPRRRALSVLFVAIVVLVAGAGVATAGAFLGWFGSGERPAEALPASTVGYVQLDLNPSLAQKMQAWNFLGNLPEVRDAVAAGEPDPKRILFELLDGDGRLSSEVDYDTDLKPWLGDRIGFGILSRANEMVVVTAVQLTDPDAGVAKLREWIAESEQAYEVTPRGEFAVVTMSKDTGYVLAELDAGTLASNQRFSADLGTLADTGMLAGWADFAGLATITNGSEPTSTNDVTGRGVFSLGFTSDTLSLDGRFIGLTTSPVSDVGELGNLPMSTGVGISVSGGAESVHAAWPRLGAQVDSWIAQYGLERADIAALLGRSFSIGLPTSGLLDADQSGPAMGIRVLSDDVARARDALRKLTASGEGAITVEDRVVGDLLVAATTSDYLEDLAAPPARLSDSANFTKAVPAHARAAGAFFVNLEPMVAQWTPPTSPYAPFLTSLLAVGGQYLDEGEGNGSWSIRLVRS